MVRREQWRDDGRLRPPVRRPEPTPAQRAAARIADERRRVREHRALLKRHVVAVRPLAGLLDGRRAYRVEAGQWLLDDDRRVLPSRSPASRSANGETDLSSGV
jgi:hypothetical protein